MSNRVGFFIVLALLAAVAFPCGTLAQDESLPVHLRDRGAGMPTSMFGTYIEAGELLIYPFLEYYLDDDLEYKPADLGYELDEDYRGKYRAVEGLVFLGYGLRDWLAIEFEAAAIDASLTTATDDASGAPRKIEESGLGDVEGQIRWRWMRERERRPEMFGYFETVFPLQKDRVLIGTQDWEFKLGTGMVKGYAWGTVTLRIAGEYDAGESKFDLGEYAAEYLRRLSPSWRVYAGIEGTQDEVELITEVQWHPTEMLTLKINNAVGLTSKATDWAPEIGIMMSFHLR